MNYFKGRVTSISSLVSGSSTFQTFIEISNIDHRFYRNQSYKNLRITYESDGVGHIDFLTIYDNETILNIYRNLTPTQVITYLNNYLYAGFQLGSPFVFISISNLTFYQSLIRNNELKVDETTMFLYQLISPKKQVTKELKSLGGQVIQINRVIDIQNLTISLKQDEQSLATEFNYVYIPSLHRYYYVNNKTLINNYVEYVLVEDVLMTYDKLIRSQTAFVTRNENIYDEDLVDKEVTYDYDKSVNYIDITPLVDVYGQSSYSETGMYILKTIDGRSV